MNYKCRLCGISDVEHPGDVCHACRSLLETKKDSTAQFDIPVIPALDCEDPYIQYREEQVPKSNNKEGLEHQADSVVEPIVNQPERAEDKAKATTAYITRGVVKNIRYNSESQSWIIRWIKSLAKGIPFSLDDYTTLFQVFPDYTGTSINESGTVCDQVVIYGKLLRGTLSDNNEVEVYGFRDRKNNIVAESVYNIASGTTVKATGSMSGTYVRLITLLLVALIVAAVHFIGKERIYQGIADIIVIIIILLIIWLLIKRFFRRLFR